MRDAATRTGPLDAARLATGAGAAANLQACAASSQFVLRGGGLAARLAGAALGMGLPTAPCRSARSGDYAALWLGPDEWLLLAPPAEEAHLDAGVTAALKSAAHCWVNVGHRNTAMTITGPRAADTLNAGCPLDLDAAAFPVGMCTRTVLAKSQIILWRREADEFYVSAERSFVPYVWDFLIEARTLL